MTSISILTILDSLQKKFKCMYSELKTKVFDLIPDNQKSWTTAMEYIGKHDDERLQIEVTHLGKKRTNTQNSAIHKYCELLAAALNEKQQLHVVRVPGHEFEVPWCAETVKFDIWHGVQKVLFPHTISKKTDKPSTAQLSTAEVSEVFIWISQNIAIHAEIDIAFPSNKR